MDMNSQYGETHDEVTVPGFESPNSPDASYNNVSDFGDEARDPPPVPTHLQHTLLHHPATKDSPLTLPLPQHVTLNHLYIETKDGPHSGVALGLTHRFLSKFVTVVLYKAGRTGGSSSNSS
uniref:Association with the SNF1 complex (ASC) domain-containing protein n=1 Tax=Kalanchoe fedtschenkoi TaxID=63787 RepID=A0A7N0U8C6_KALFE